MRSISSSRIPYHLERKKGYASSSIESNPEISPVRYKKRMFTLDELVGEWRRIKPPTFDGEVKQEKDVEAWLIGLRKFFQLHQYTPNMEARVAIYHLQGKATIWWDQLVKLKDIDEDKTSWRKFKKYFQKEYLSEHYYDKKMEELFELKLGSMTMEAYEKKFLELLNYADFIKDEKVKIQRFLTSLI